MGKTEVVVGFGPGWIELDGASHHADRAGVALELEQATAI